MTTSEKAVWATMIGLAVLGGLLLVAIALGSAAGDAVEQALAGDPYAASTQRSTQVCVGLLNLGACRATQTSTSTAIRQQRRDNDDLTKDLLALACVVPLSLFVIVGAAIKVVGDER